MVCTCAKHRHKAAFCYQILPSPTEFCQVSPSLAQKKSKGAWGLPLIFCSAADHEALSGQTFATDCNCLCLYDKKHLVHESAMVWDSMETISAGNKVYDGKLCFTLEAIGLFATRLDWFQMPGMASFVNIKQRWGCRRTRPAPPPGSCSAVPVKIRRAVHAITHRETVRPFCSVGRMIIIINMTVRPFCSVGRIGSPT